jgi:pseudoazurin
MKFKSLIAAVGAAALMSTSAMAAEHTVTANVTNFDPLVIVVEPGDSVSWVNMSGHIVNTVFTDANGESQYIPEGATGFTSEMGENFSTGPLTVEGVYLYKCDPHWGAGMGGAIVVGNPTNLEAIKAMKPKGALKRLVKKTDKALK